MNGLPRRSSMKKLKFAAIFRHKKSFVKLFPCTVEINLSKKRLNTISQCYTTIYYFRRKAFWCPCSAAFEIMSVASPMEI